MSDPIPVTPLPLGVASLSRVFRYEGRLYRVTGRDDEPCVVEEVEDGEIYGDLG